MAGRKGQRSGGHRAKTIQQHLLDGTYSPKDHGGKVSPNLEAGLPEPPGPLTGAARKEWARMTALLLQTQLLTVVDGAMLYQYCRLYADAETARRDIERLRGQVRRRRRLKLTRRQVDAIEQQVTRVQSVLLRLAQQIRQHLVEFGLSPASRGRVNLSAAGAGLADPATPATPADGMAEFDAPPAGPLSLVHPRPA